MKKRLGLLCLVGYLMPILLGIAGSFWGSEVEFTVFMIMIGIFILFLDCIFIIAYCRAKEIKSNGLMAFCYLGMAPFALCLFLWMLSGGYGGG